MTSFKLSDHHFKDSKLFPNVSSLIVDPFGTGERLLGLSARILDGIHLKTPGSCYTRHRVVDYWTHRITLAFFPGSLLVSEPVSVLFAIFASI